MPGLHFREYHLATWEMRLNLVSLKIILEYYSLCFWPFIDVEIAERNADQAQKLVDSEKISV